MWQFQNQMIRLYNRKDKATLVLSVVNTGNKFSCFAVETAGNNAQSVLESHGHHIVGHRNELAQALLMGEGFAKSWLRGDKKIEDCKCEEF